MYLSGNVLQYAVILDFRPRLKNHYRKVVVQRQRFPRPILIFVASKKNGPPAEVVSTKKNGFAYPCCNNAPRSIFLKYT